MRRLASILLTVLALNVCFSQRHDILIKDGVIHLEIYGEGTPVLIINGGPGMNSQGFRGLAAIIGKTNKAIIYDQRGTGESSLAKIDATTITMDKMVADIERIRNYLKIEEWVVLGHSFGGMLASYYAVKYPQNISGLILSSSGGINLDLLSNLNITAKLTTTQRDSLNYWNNRITSGDTTFYARLQRGRFLAPAYLYDQTHVETVAQRLTQGNRVINGLLFQDMRRINFDCTSALSKFEQPVLIIQGKNDVIDPSIAEYAHAVFPDSKLVLLDQCAHYGWLDQTELYFRAINTFLKRFD